MGLEKCLVKEGQGLLGTRTGEEEEEEAQFPFFRGGNKLPKDWGWKSLTRGSVQGQGACGEPLMGGHGELSQKA